MIGAAIFILKFLTYAATFVGAGVVLSARTLRGSFDELAVRGARIGIGASFGLAVVSVLSLLLLIAELDTSFSASVVALVVGSSAGIAAALQVAGAMLLAFSLWHARRISAVAVAGALLMLAAFGVNGHAAGESALGSMVALLHVSLAAWWCGALLLLSRACQSEPSEPATLAVRRFSQQAIVIAGALVFSGAGLVLIILGFDHLRHWTPYLQTLIVKLLCVAIALSVAAYNRFRLVPRMAAYSSGALAALRRTIAIELTLIVGALVATAWLTTHESPHG